jgi:hypothetical protein
LVERDKLAAERAEVYPPLAEKLAELAARVATNDAALERVNRKLPNEATWIAGAEPIARQLGNFFDGTGNIPRITEHMRLPAFRYSGRNPYARGRERNKSAQFVECPVVYRPRARCSSSVPSGESLVS